MKEKIIKVMGEFAERVLKGDATPQETAILPKILKMLIEVEAEKN